MTSVKAPALGVPLLLLREAEGHAVTAETRDGCTHRGTLVAAEESMNLTLAAVFLTHRNGKTTR